MKKLLFTILLSSVFSLMKAQEKYGNALNVGVGANYYGYYYAAPALHLNYEFDVFKNLTLAPFITYSTFKSSRIWGDADSPDRSYFYRETSIPVGLKASYYFDELFEASEKWDFYFGGSLGFAFRSTVWDAGYRGETMVHTYKSPVFGLLHLGTEYHFNNSIGMFLDLATGYTTVGVAIHL